MRYSRWPSSPEIRGSIPLWVLAAVKCVILRCDTVHGALLHGQLLEATCFVVWGVFYSTKICSISTT